MPVMSVSGLFCVQNVEGVEKPGGESEGFEKEILD